MTTEAIYAAVGMQDATRETVEGFAKEMGIEFNSDTPDLELTMKTHQNIGTLADNDWELLTTECKEWDVAMTNAIKVEAAKPTPKRTPKKKPAPTAPPEESSKEEVPVADQVNACRTKKALVELAEKLGSTLKIVMSWKLKDMKEKLIEDLANACAAPDTAGDEGPTRVKADANAPEPSAAEVKKAQADAKARADAAKANKVSRKMEEGEPYCRNTTAWMIWDVLRRAKKALTAKEVRDRFMEAYDAQTEVTSTNPAGRVNVILGGMKRQGIAIHDKAAGTYELAPEK